MKLFSVATALLALAAFASAQEVDKRLVDISETQVNVVEAVQTKPNVDTFVVTVQRTDDLLTDEGGFLAERVMSVAFNFDVQNHEVLLNNVPLALEPKDSPEDPVTLTVEVNAALFVGPGLDPSVESLMDAGLVTVQVQALTEFVTAEDGSLVRRVTLQETIVEVNGREIKQTQVAQQIIEIMPDGTLGSYTPLPGSGCQQDGLDEAMEALDNWFRSLNWPGFVLAGMVAISMFVLSATSLRSLVRKRREARYAKVQQAEASEEYVQVAIADEKYDDEKKALVQ
ncbi:hypothetical protein BGZ70_006698 [Mortierella alpina]|uniref:Increased recombination centers protein 22 n=1 Tax=Mortierella alpina TaxID=64518 RepID=A0A9P6J7L7_MORAP|nr:hypothetical protein BGZ70_006698 [Mortierella alpina]